VSQTLDRLRELGDKKIGDPMPTWLPINNWANPLSELCRSAVEEIERMQAILVRINEICRIPTTAHMKAHTHFQRDFDEIRALTKEFRDDADSRA
jgi:hypothetical protein